MQRRFVTGQILKARRNKNILSFDFKVSDSYIIEFPAQDCSIRREHTRWKSDSRTLLVLGTAIRERVDDLSDILDAVTRLEMRLFKYAAVAGSRTLNVRTAIL